VRVGCGQLVERAEQPDDVEPRGQLVEARA
jgi:hypothetical protein